MKKDTRDRLITIAIILIVVLLFGSAKMWINSNELNKVKGVCEEKGHKEITDNNNVLSTTLTCIECDNQFVYCKDRFNYTCEQKDKWGTCLRGHYEFKLVEK